MRKAGTTLVELIVALAAASLVALVAGWLLIDGLESWRVQTDRDTALRHATATLDAFSADLAAQSDWPDLPAPVTAFTFSAASPKTAFLVAASKSREQSVCWYVTGNGPWTLWRYEADADATHAALPGNAAANAVTTALSSDDATLVKLETGSREFCDGVTDLCLDQPSGSVATQLRLTIDTPEGLDRLAKGATAAQLPERCKLDVSRTILLP